MFNTSGKHVLWILKPGFLIGKLKTSKSFGDDGISSYFLKLELSFIEDSLVYLFNTSLETSQFPDH